MDKKNKILNLPKVAQHYVKNLLNSDKHKKYDSIVEDIIKEKRQWQLHLAGELAL